MTTPRNLDSRFIAARRVLLDALHALAPQSSAVIVAGAQAIYLRTGDADFALAPFTIDSDLAIDPTRLSDEPQLEVAMGGADFELLVRDSGHVAPGIWVTQALIEGRPEKVPVDLIVPDGVAPPGGRRGARLGVHGNRAALRLTGLEAALVDHSPVLITPLDPDDTRSITAEVAGPAALMIAKAHKINDRVNDGKTRRIMDKDASDVVRLMQTTAPSELGPVFATLLRDPVASSSTHDGLNYLRQLFGRRAGAGVSMASSALRAAIDPETVVVICNSFIAQLDAALGGSPSE